MGGSQFKGYAVETPTGVRCEFCGEEYAGNVARFKWHLAKIEGHDINICPLVPEDVREAASAYATSEESPSRKRVSSTADENPSSKHRCISNPTIITGAATPIPNSPPVKNSGAGAFNIEQLFAAKIVGSQFPIYFSNILSCLTDDNVSTLGICGVAGVGKTKVARFLVSHLLEAHHKFQQVIFVDASLDWRLKNTSLSPHRKIHKMQTVISRSIGLDLLDDGDNEKRRIQLSHVLTEKSNCLVILDDVWDYFSLQEVGIPVGVNQCKVVMTTQSLTVCREFGCQRRIDIKCLQPDEAFELYKNTLGNDTKLSEEGVKISRSIVDKCGGLPLAVKTMARYMKGITDPNQLRSAVDGIIRKKAMAQIFPQLKLSYEHLQDPTLKNCFLYCLFFVGEDSETLMKFLVDEGIIKGMTSRRGQLREADTMLRILKDVCLLENDDYGFGLVQMNEVIRSMGLQIMEENQERVMIIKGKSLQVLPALKSWTENLVRVSLTNNRIEEIPVNYLPSSSKLSTLLLENYTLRYIGDSFFKGLPGLRVLCLSETSIESLPLSVCGLVNLTTLLLFNCKNLRKIPSVAKLRALKKLDLSYSGVEEVPDDIEMLSELEYRDLYGTHVKELKSGVLAKFSYLQFLALLWSSAVKAEEIACLSWLEVLVCRFTDLVELNKYLMHLKGFKEREPPLRLHVQAGGLNIQCPFYTAFHESLMSDKYDNDFYRDTVGDYCYDDWSVLGLHQCNVNELVDVMNNFQMIVVVNCNGSSSFCDFSPVKNGAEFKNFSVRDCDGLEFLFSWSLPAKGILEKLENIALINLGNFSRLFSKAGDLSARPPYGTCFSHLRRFLIRDCPSIKQLFPLDLLTNLQNLEVIDVRNCARMVEIFATEEHEEEGNSVVQQTKWLGLPKLRWFRLRDLPELTRVANVKIFCVALNCIFFENCPNLEMADVQFYCTTPRQTCFKVPFRRCRKDLRFYPSN